MGIKTLLKKGRIPEGIVDVADREGLDIEVLKLGILQGKIVIPKNKKRDWDRQFELIIDPDKAKEIRKKVAPHVEDVCSMCGKYCAIKLLNDTLKKE